MAIVPQFDDLSYGDETRRHGDYVGLPHDEANDATAPVEGQAVMLSGDLAKVPTAATDPVVGVAYTYNYTGDSGGPADPGTIKQDAPLTVKTRGTVKAEVESTVSAGDGLDAGVATDGVFDTATSEGQENRAIALTDAKQDDRPDGTTAYYADVLLL